VLLSGLGWLLSAVADAASAEMDGDVNLREALLAAEEQHRRGEISGEQFAAIEEDILSRISELLGDGASDGPIVLTGTTHGDAREPLEVEACVLGDFHAPAPAAAPGRPRRGGRAGHARRKT